MTCDQIFRECLKFQPPAGITMTVLKLDCGLCVEVMMAFNDWTSDRKFGAVDSPDVALGRAMIADRLARDCGLLIDAASGVPKSCDEDRSFAARLLAEPLTARSN